MLDLGRWMSKVLGTGSLAPWRERDMHGGNWEKDDNRFYKIVVPTWISDEGM